MIVITLLLVFSQKSAADGLHLGVNEDLYKAVWRVFLCLDALTDLLLTPGGTGEDDKQLRLLQQEVADYNINSKTNMTTHFSGSVLCEQKCQHIFAFFFPSSVYF